MESSKLETIKVTGRENEQLLTTEVFLFPSLNLHIFFSFLSLCYMFIPEILRKTPYKKQPSYSSDEEFPHTDVADATEF